MIQALPNSPKSKIKTEKKTDWSGAWTHALNVFYLDTAVEQNGTNEHLFITTQQSRMLPPTLIFFTILFTLISVLL